MSQLKLDEGYKIVYSRNNMNKTFIEELLAIVGMKDEISEIKTGRGGQLALEAIDTKYKDLIVWNKDFDPVYADHEVNPLISSGYRLSSHMYFIKNGDEILKVIPKK